MNIQKITAIIRPERLDKVEIELKKHGVCGMSVSSVKGFGEYANSYQANELS